MPLSPTAYYHLWQIIQAVGVSFSGTASSDVLAVAVLLYGTDGTTLLRMETVGVTLGDNENTFSGTINIILSSGTYTMKAANYEGGDFTVSTFTVSSSPAEDEDTGNLLFF